MNGCIEAHRKSFCVDCSGHQRLSSEMLVAGMMAQLLVNAVCLSPETSTGLLMTWSARRSPLLNIAVSHHQRNHSLNLQKTVLSLGVA